MDPVVEVLQEMRGRIPMYLGSNSITKLAAFLRGYYAALERQGLGKATKYIAALQGAVEAKFPTKVSKSWEEVILFHSSGDDEAMRIFWDIFDELDAGKGKTNQLGAKGAA